MLLHTWDAVFEGALLLLLLAFPLRLLLQWYIFSLTILLLLFLLSPFSSSHFSSSFSSPPTPSLSSSLFLFFGSAAQGGHPFAAFNLGIAHLYGYGMPRGRRNAGIAGEWFEHSGLPEGLWAKAMHSRSEGRENEALWYEKRAKKIGFGAPWRRAARAKTGSGGASGVELNLSWPKQPSGDKPPEW